MRSTIRERLGLAFLITFVVFITLVVYSYRRTQQASVAGRSAEASHALLTELERTLSTLQEARASHRAFLLAGEAADLQNLERTRMLLRAHTGRMSGFGIETAGIDSLVGQELAAMDSSVGLYRSGRPGAARDAAARWDDRSAIDRLRGMIAAATSERAAIAEAEGRQASARSLDVVLAVTALSLIGLAIHGALGLALLRYVNERARVEAAFETQRENLDERIRERTAELERERARAEAEAERAQGALAERMRAESARAHSETQYRTLVEQVKDYAIFQIDREGRPQSWNEGVGRVLGYDEGEFLGSDVGLIFTERDRAAGVPSRELETAVTHGVASNDRWMRRKDGTHFFAAGTTTALHDGNGTHIGFTKVMRDQTAWKETEEALRRSETRYRLVARASREAIWDWNLISDQIDWNEGIEHLFGYRLDEVPSDVTWWHERVHPDDRNRVVTGLRNAIESGAEFWTEEYRFCRADGSYAVVTDRGVVARDQRGQGYRMLGTIADFTERRRAEEKLAQAQRIEAVGRLAGGIAHDLNNMLTTIVGYSMFLEQSLAADDENRRADVAEIRKAADRSAALTRSLLAFARRELIRPQPLDLNEVVRDTERVLRPALGESIAVETRLTAAEPTVFADRGRLEQVVLNLALNARDAMPTGGRLTITTENVVLGPEDASRHPGTEIIPGPYVRMVMTDTGHGMDPGTLSRIFEPFFTTKDIGEGTGLGLATVYGTVKQAGGFIWAYSEPSYGSSFTVYLPSVLDDDVVIETPAPELRAVEGGSETIVVVEDEDTVRMLAWRTLGAAGYDCHQAVDASAALSLLRRIKGPVHLLLTDIVMPGMGGEELARELRPGRPEMKILYTSGFTDDEVVRRGLMRQGAPFIQKPWAPEQLLRRVREVLDAEVPLAQKT
ncbi:MAG TPA: PAS domain S-box protein [Gemmatimonadales bacterium]|nr:PAS domain S-box protein [Gemmatimonadales bacterium]